MFPFDSDRKRQSVVVEHEGSFTLFTKGADSEIFKRLNLNFAQPFIVETQKALDAFSVVGLRTLVFACRSIPASQYKKFEREYIDAARSVDKKKRIAELGVRMETDLILLGCSAIEDNLQEQVPESIQRFFQANIKIWMITGDKFETAENIGFCSGIIPKGAKVFRFKNVSRSDFCQKVKLLKRQFQEENDEVQKAIVIDTTKISRQL